MKHPRLLLAILLITLGQALAAGPTLIKDPQFQGTAQSALNMNTNVITNVGGVTHANAASASTTLSDLNNATTTLNWARVLKTGSNLTDLTNRAFGSLQSLPTTLAGYGITDAQPLDSDLTSIAALTTTTFGRSLLTQADATALRSTSGLALGTNVQAWDADLDGWATKTIPSGAAVGTTDTQTLTNKTLTSPVLSGTVSGNATVPPQVTAQRTTFANANATATAGTRYLAQTGTLTAARTVTLFAASAVPAGYELIIADESGSVTGTNTIVIARAGADTINGLTSEVIGSAYGWRRLISDGVSKWTWDAGEGRLSQSNVWAQNQMLSGSNNTAPNQAATSSSSLMTRVFVSVETLFSFQRWLHPGDFTVTNTGAQSYSNTAFPNNGYATMGFNAATAAGNNTRISCVVKSGNGGGPYLRPAEKVWISFYCGFPTNDGTQSKLMMIYGGDQASGLPNTKSFGISVFPNQTNDVALYVHDGTTLYTQTLQIAASTFYTESDHFILEWDGDKTLRCYIATDSFSALRPVLVGSVSAPATVTGDWAGYNIGFWCYAISAVTSGQLYQLSQPRILINP
jgi:hypothetical protein